MNAFAAAAAAMVADANMGVSATYRPLTGGSFACRVIVSRPVDAITGQILASGVAVSIPAEAVAFPKRGDQLDIPSLPAPNVFAVSSVETDAGRVMHNLTLVLA